MFYLSPFFIKTGDKMNAATLRLFNAIQVENTNEGCDKSRDFLERSNKKSGFRRWQ